jgi:hypothetical protein
MWLYMDEGFLRGETSRQVTFMENGKAMDAARVVLYVLSCILSVPWFKGLTLRFYIVDTGGIMDEALHKLNRYWVLVVFTAVSAVLSCKISYLMRDKHLQA